MRKRNQWEKILLALVVLMGLFGCKKKELNVDSKNSQSSSSSISHKSVSSTSSLVTSQSEQDSSTISSQQSTTNGKKQYSDDEKKSISNEFLDWAGERAKIGGMAVCSYFFDHGASGKGDWYAVVGDAQYVLVQQQATDIRNYDYSYYANSVGGLVFYYSKFNTTGITDEINDPQNNPSYATGYSAVADLNQPIVKYLLADNGVVYEYNSSSSFRDGFYVTDDDGNFDYWPGPQNPFKISEDQDAQTKYQEILSNYN